MNTNGIDLIGRIFGRLTVLSIAGRDSKGQLKWLCRCQCGTEKVVLGGNLRNPIRGTKSCGCILKETPPRKVIDRIGKVYGKLTVINFVGRNDKGDYLWLCRCECGKEKIVISSDLNINSTHGCGDVIHRQGENSTWWRGGRRKNMNGYIEIKMWGHPNSFKNGYVCEHVYIMSQLLGRPLTKDETVHHKNGIRDDNSPENLELWVSNHPKGQRVSDLVIWAKEIISKYESIALK